MILLLILMGEKVKHLSFTTSFFTV